MRTNRQNLPIGPAAVLAVAMLAAACTGTNGKSLAPQVGQRAPDSYQPGKPYELSKEELALDCKKLTGRMQVRILQVRDTENRGRGSAVAQATQTAVTPILGGSMRGADPATDFARDRAYLQALNRQLAAKNCATFDLDAELQPRSIYDTPTPVPKK